MERRMFHRQSVSVNGDLTWVTKGRFGRKERQHSYVRTSNLSLDGARVDMRGHFPFAVDARARLQLGIHYCDVRILDVSHTANATTLRLFFMSPKRDFVAVLEENLQTVTTNRATVEGKWR